MKQLLLTPLISMDVFKDVEALGRGTVVVIDAKV
jgi:hypothetical protein